jgi:hypothetical protein
MKLATNSEFRSSMARVKDAMEKVGLDLTSPVSCAGCDALLLITHFITGYFARSYESTEDFRT